jgi:HEAT repeat protein
MNRIQCPACNKRLKFEARLAGRVVQCPSCGGRVALPLDDAPAEPSPAPEDGDGDELARLLAALRDSPEGDDPLGRELAAGELAHFKGDEAIEALSAALGDDPEWQVRQSAASSLGEIGGPAVREPLMRALANDRQAEVRVAAVRALGRSGGKSDFFVSTLAMYARGAVEGPLESAQRGAGPEAAVQMVQFAADQVLRSLDPDPELERLIAEVAARRLNQAAEELGLRGDRRAVEPLISLLELPLEMPEDAYAFQLRSMAAIALGRLRDSRALGPLVHALNDQETSVRESAARALGDLSDRRAISPLVSVARRRAGFESYYAVTSLGNLRDPAAVAPLLEMLDDYASGRQKDDLLLSYICESLGRIGDASALEPLRGLYAARGTARLFYLARALACLGDGEARSWIESELKSINASRRIESAATLGQIGAVSAVEALIGALADAEWQVREQAARSLGLLGDPRAVPALTRASFEQDPYTRRAAEEALARLSPARPSES